MKLKYNFNGVTNEIPLTSKKPAGKRLAVRHNGQNYYAALVETSDTSASNLRAVFNGVEFAIQQQQLPQITDLTITPPTLSAMQGQSATATLTAMTNEQVAGLSYSLDNPPTWITISDDVILIEPSDNDLGQAVVQVYARDTGSDASASAPFVAEALLRPIIESLYVIPPAVTVQQGQSATAALSAVANAAVTGLSYSISGQSSWVNLNGDVIEMNPSDNDLGDNTVNVVAFDTNSSASAATQFVASAALRPIINAVTANPADVTVNQGQSAFVTLSADANAAVAGLSYSLANAPTWMTLGNDVITLAPTDNDLGTVTVTATARDINSSASASTTFTATAEIPSAQINDISITPVSLYTTVDGTKYATLTADATGTDEVTFSQLAGAEKSWITVAADGLTTLKPTAAGFATAGTHSLQVEASGGGSTCVKTFLVNVAKATPLLSVSPQQATLGRVVGRDAYSTVNVTVTSSSNAKKFAKGIYANFPKRNPISYNADTGVLMFVGNMRYGSNSSNDTATMSIGVVENDYYLAQSRIFTLHGSIERTSDGSYGQQAVDWVEP